MIAAAVHARLADVTRVYPGKRPVHALGPVSFDKKGDTVGGGYVFYVWKNGAYAQM